MIILEHSLPEIMAVLGIPHKENIKYRYCKFVIFEKVKEGYLIFNDLTRSFLLLSFDEFNNMPQDTLDFLIKNYFLVPSDYNEMEAGDMLKKRKYDMKVLSNQNASQYTILPTTSCNARCFYCYENGCKTKVMTEETAKKVVQYIIEHHDTSRPLGLHWFGGEPTCNIKAIDIICQGLADAKIEYFSEMISNGYLLNKHNLERMKNLWLLKSVQITIDGTENVYNKAKNFIYKDNAFNVVLNNIELLLSNNITVQVRLNIGEHNIDDLDSLLDQMHNRFRRNSSLSVYCMPLFGEFTREIRCKLYEYADKLNTKIVSLGYRGADLNRKYEDSMCSADCGKSLQILPDGNISLCEHSIDEDFVGNIFDSVLNFKRIGEWTQRIDKQEGCDGCPFYSSCIKLKHCPERYVCYFEERDYHIKEYKKFMARYFEKAKSSQYYQEQLMRQNNM